MNSIKYIFIATILTVSYNASGMFGFGQELTGQPSETQQKFFSDSEFAHENNQIAPAWPIPLLKYQSTQNTNGQFLSRKESPVSYKKPCVIQSAFRLKEIDDLRFKKEYPRSWVAQQQAPEFAHKKNQPTPTYSIAPALQILQIKSQTIKNTNGQFLSSKENQENHKSTCVIRSKNGTTPKVLAERNK